MSTVWIVPFLMFLEVTNMVAAVPLAAATTAATIAAISAFFKLCDPFLCLRLVAVAVGASPAIAGKSLSHEKLQLALTPANWSFGQSGEVSARLGTLIVDEAPATLSQLSFEGRYATPGPPGISCREERGFRAARVALVRL
jgi:hypothetical protein